MNHAPDESADAQPESDAPRSPGLWRGWIRPLLVMLLIITALRSSLVDWNDVPSGSMIPTIVEGDRIVVNKLAYGLNLPFNGPALLLPLYNQPLPNPLDFLPGFYWSGPQRNAIVTFWKPSVDARGRPIADGGIRMVKRVVAVPGDTVAMRDAVISVMGRPYAISKLIINGQEAQYAVSDAGITETILGESRRVTYARNLRDPRGKQFRPDPRAINFGPVTLDPDEYLMIGDNRDNSADGRFFGPVTLENITGKAKFIAVSFDEGWLDPRWDRWFSAFR